jgi:predicted small metal-binding protein
MVPVISLAGGEGGMDMKVVSCRDVGMDCDFQARGATVEEVMKKCTEHARSAHDMDEIPAELVMKVKAAIHEERVA